jgi:putative transposase
MDVVKQFIFTEVAMKGSVGCPTRIVTCIPNLHTVAKLREVELSKEVEFRLKLFDWYYHKSPFVKGNKTGKPNAALTCRHFGIHRSYFYRWLKRYDKKRLPSLENRSRAPAKKRRPRYSRAFVQAVREIRKADPTYSGKKIRIILLRTMPKNEVPSVATISRLISREGLFFRADVSRRKKRRRAAKNGHERRRKPRNLAKESVVEFDMKYVYLLGVKLYAFCAVRISTREAVIRIASSPSSLNAKNALEQVIARWGKDMCIVNDNGGENMCKAEEYQRGIGVTQYWTHPRCPEEKPFVERFIGTLQKECLDYHYEPMNVGELSEIVDTWLDKYHHYRPHEALGGMTPAQFSATLGVSIPKRDVSYMY